MYIHNGQAPLYALVLMYTQKIHDSSVFSEIDFSHDLVLSRTRSCIGTEERADAGIPLGARWSNPRLFAGAALRTSGLLRAMRAEEVRRAALLLRCDRT